MVLRATSDLHLTADNAEFVFAALRQLEADAKAHGGPTFLLGDILHTAETVHMPTWNRLRFMLQHWPDDVYVLVGNHDQYDRPRNALEGLAGNKCRVISTPVWSRWGRLIPYTPAREFDATLRDLRGAPVGGNFMLPIVWCHHGFTGAYMNSMRRDRKGVACSAVPDDHVIITGHYHLPQVLGRIVYTGSPFEHTFAEEGQLKGWLRWPDPFANLIPDRIAFTDTGAPNHVTVKWDIAGGFEYPRDFDRTKDRLRVRTLATREQVKDKSDLIQKAGLAGVPILARSTTAVGRGVVRPGASPIEAVKQWIENVHGVDTNLATPSEMWQWQRDHDLILG